MAETGTVSLAELDAQDARPFKHVPGLDGLRALAVILVIVFHYGSIWSKHDDGGIFPGGFIGVDVFFVLSGFLITSLLVGERAKTGRVSFARFYARRSARLIPALVLLLIGFGLWTHHQGAKWSALVKPSAAALLYVSNLAQVYFLKSMLHTGLSFTWSLAIEEQFYLVWPALLVFGVLRFAKTRHAVLISIGAGALVSALIRLYIWNWGSAYPAAYMRLDARADGLLLGALCAFLWRWRMVPTRWLNEAALVSLVALIGVTFLWPRESGGMFQGGFTLVSLAVAVILLAIAENVFQLIPLFETSVMRAIGRVSYGLYLWHGLCLRIAADQLQGRGKFVVAIGGLALTGVIVTISWYAVEQPFLRLKDRLFASPVAH
jgi:peptidoglycan/LPS O-acetylase OafA/YrhL